jgi:hypothetical protein
MNIRTQGASTQLLLAQTLIHRCCTVPGVVIKLLLLLLWTKLRPRSTRARPKRTSDVQYSSCMRQRRVATRHHAAATHN